MLLFSFNIAQWYFIQEAILRLGEGRRKEGRRNINLDLELGALL